MAPDEVVKLGGLRSNSLAADNALGTALDGALDVCAGVCCCAACIAAAPGAGRLEARGVKDVASSSGILGNEVVMLDDLNHGVDQEHKRKT